MAKYEVWKKEDIATRRGTCARSHYTLDMAMSSAKELSKGSIKRQVWDYKGGSIWNGNGTQIEIEIPNAYAVIEKETQSRCRGWGIGGVWHDAKNCKSCANTGEDKGHYGEPCPSCKGSSYRPKV